MQRVTEAEMERDIARAEVAESRWMSPSKDSEKLREELSAAEVSEMRCRLVLHRERSGQWRSRAKTTRWSINTTLSVGGKRQREYRMIHRQREYGLMHFAS